MAFHSGNVFFDDSERIVLFLHSKEALHETLTGYFGCLFLLFQLIFVEDSHNWENQANLLEILTFSLQSKDPITRRIALVLIGFLSQAAEKRDQNIFEESGMTPIKGKIILTSLKSLQDQNKATPKKKVSLEETLRMIKDSQVPADTKQPFLWRVSLKEKSDFRAFGMSETLEMIEEKKFSELPDPVDSVAGCFLGLVSKENEKPSPLQKLRGSSRKNKERRLGLSFQLDNSSALSEKTNRSMVQNSLHGPGKHGTPRNIRIPLKPRDQKTRSKSLRSEEIPKRILDTEVLNEAEKLHGNPENGSKQTMDTMGTRNTTAECPNKIQGTPPQKEKGQEEKQANQFKSERETRNGGALSKNRETSETRNQNAENLRENEKSKETNSFEKNQRESEGVSAPKGKNISIKLIEDSYSKLAKRIINERTKRENSPSKNEKVGAVDELLKSEKPSEKYSTNFRGICQSKKSKGPNYTGNQSKVVNRSLILQIESMTREVQGNGPRIRSKSPKNASEKQEMSVDEPRVPSVVLRGLIKDRKTPRTSKTPRKPSFL